MSCASQHFKVIGLPTYGLAGGVAGAVPSAGGGVVAGGVPSAGGVAGVSPPAGSAGSVEAGAAGVVPASDGALTAGGVTGAGAGASPQPTSEIPRPNRASKTNSFFMA